MRNDKEHLALKAQQLLDDEVLKGAFDALEGSILSEIKHANINGTDDSEKFILELARKLQTVEGVKKALRARINNYKLTHKSE